MRDDNEGAALSDAQQIGVDDGFAFSVERARCLVEDKDTRIADQRPGNREALALATREIGGAFLDISFVASRQMLDELLCAGQSCREHYVLKTGVRLSRRDRFAN